MDIYQIVKSNLSFGAAFDEIKNSVQPGIGMRLPKWSADVVIRVQVPDEHSKMTAPYLYVESRFGRVPWKETMIELFSNEWQIVVEEPEDDEEDEEETTEDNCY